MKFKWVYCPACSRKFKAPIDLYNLVWKDNIHNFIVCSDRCTDAGYRNCVTIEMLREEVTV